MDDHMNSLVKRNFSIRLIAGLFWLLITMLLGLAIVGAIIGLGSGPDTSGMSISDAVVAGQQAGSNAATSFMAAHMGKVIVGLFLLWLGLSFFSIYPGTSKYKK